MYTRHFGLRSLPFENTPDPAFFFMEGQYRDALAVMIYIFRSRKGLLGLVGPSGCGKTTLSHILTGHLPERTKLITLVHHRARPLDILKLVAERFKVQTDHDSVAILTSDIRDKLLSLHDRGIRCILIIDEAQSMSDIVFEEVQLLSNLETIDTKLIQIMLLGRSQLLEKLDKPKLSSLRQRVSMIQTLQPLSLKDTARYVRHRLKVAGGSLDIFTPQALAMTHKISTGVPRLINKLSDLALLKSFIAGLKKVESTKILEASNDLGLEVPEDIDDLDLSFMEEIRTLEDQEPPITDESESPASADDQDEKMAEDTIDESAPAPVEETPGFPAEDSPPSADFRSPVPEQPQTTPEVNKFLANKSRLDALFDSAPEPKSLGPAATATRQQPLNNEPTEAPPQTADSPGPESQLTADASEDAEVESIIPTMEESPVGPPSAEPEPGRPADKPTVPQPALTVGVAKPTEPDDLPPTRRPGAYTPAKLSKASEKKAAGKSSLRERLMGGDRSEEVRKPPPVPDKKLARIKKPKSAAASFYLSPTVEIGRRASKGRGSKKLYITGLALFVIVLAAIAGGILWQNGVIDPMAWFRSDPVPLAKALTPIEPLDIPIITASKTDTIPEDVEPPTLSTSIPTGPTALEAAKSDIRPSRPLTSLDLLGSTPGELISTEKPDAPATPSTTATQPPEPSAPTAHYPYSLQLSTFFSMSATQRAMKIYRKMGFNPYWIRFRRADEETVYQVFIGSFKDRAEAEKGREEIGTKDPEFKKAYISETPLANLIGTFKSGDEVQKEISRLEKLGFSPYTIKMDDGSQKLFIGAFTKKRSAEAQKRRLEARGVESQVVER